MTSIPRHMILTPDQITRLTLNAKAQKAARARMRRYQGNDELRYQTAVIDFLNLKKVRSGILRNG